MNYHFSVAPLFLLLLVGRSLATARFDPPAGRCSADKPCKQGYCCSKWGFCGTTSAYCSKANCAFQCPTLMVNNSLAASQSDPPAGSCGPDNPCEDGSCCSIWGFCGGTWDYCSEERCVSQCSYLKVSHSLASSRSDPPVGICSEDKPCKEGYCCSKWGFCGTTDAYCGKENCAFQCPPWVLLKTVV